MRYRDVARKLRKLGCEELPRRGGGSHRKWHNPATVRFVSVPDWGRKDLKPGTLRHIIRRLGLGWEAFKEA
jgi:predicted RNA binding protein YcfA (HicA-like mRNA interferase family)